MTPRALCLALLAVTLPLAACAPNAVGGIRGETAFVATARLDTLRVDRSPSAIADCFRNTGSFLPRSRFEPYGDGGSRYVLAGYGLWFEDIRFLPDPPGATLIEIRTSGNYDARWRTMFVEQRLEPLMACLPPGATVMSEYNR